MVNTCEHEREGFWLRLQLNSHSEERQGAWRVIGEQTKYCYGRGQEACGGYPTGYVYTVDVRAEAEKGGKAFFNSFPRAHPEGLFIVEATASSTGHLLIVNFIGEKGSHLPTLVGYLRSTLYAARST